MTSVQPILKAYTEGHSALRLTGRSLYDFVADDGRLRPFVEFLRRVLFRDFGMVFINYSLANGLNWFESWITDDSDRQTIRELLRNHHLLEVPPSPNEVVAIVRGIASLSRATTDNLQWKDGRQMRFTICIEFTEHLAPGSLTNGTQTDGQLIVTELVHLTSQSLALRNSGNLILFHGRDGLVDDLVCSALKHVRLLQPDKEEKQEFLDTALELYTDAALEDGLTKEGVVNLTINTPNRGLEGLVRASHRGRRDLTAKEIAEQKNRDIEQLSEQTLRPLDTDRVKNLSLAGKNIARPQEILLQLADSLLRGETSMPANVLLAGAPGVAKTDLALLVAERAKAPSYEMLSPKGSMVGDTERRARLQQQILKDGVPNVAFCDEITEAFPLQRSEFDGDSGASRAVTAALLTALSDETRRGRSLLIATTNCPWRMGAAMRSRFTIIPVLFPQAQDFPRIILATANRISLGCDFDLDDPQLVQAARIFFQKGANPRHIRSALSNTLILLKKDRFEASDILFAAQDLCSTTDFHSAIYADLWAIKCCSSKAFLPWGASPRDYVFPDYLKDVVSSETGDILVENLNARIREFKPNANV